MLARTFVTVCAGAAFLGGSGAYARGQDEIVELLSGIEPVAVVIEDVDEAAEQDGLTLTMLREAVEERLRQAGVPQAGTPGPYLYVNVNAMKLTSAPAYVYSIAVELKQRVQIVRAGDVTEASDQTGSATAPTGSSDSHVATGPLTFGATTWSRGSIGYVPAERIWEIRDAVLGYVDEFNQVYLTANPQ